MKWVMCKQTIHDSVCYTTSENQDLMYLSYYAFLEYVHSLTLIDFIGFKNSLDKFDIIFINIDDHSWRLQKEEDNRGYSFEELLDLNSDKQKDLTKIERIKMKLSQFSKVRTHGGESGNRKSPDGASTTVVGRETRRGIRIPLKGERSRI